MGGSLYIMLGPFYTDTLFGENSSRYIHQEQQSENLIVDYNSFLQMCAQVVECTSC